MDGLSTTTKYPIITINFNKTGTNLGSTEENVFIDDRDELNTFLKKDTAVDSPPLNIGTGVYNDLFVAYVNKNLKAIAHGAYNTVFIVNDKYVLRITNLTEEYKKEIVDNELFGLNMQQRLSGCNYISKIYAYGVMVVHSNETYKSQQAFAIMDKLKGGDLYQRVKRSHDKITHPQIISIMGKLLTALQCIDNNGYCYRDMKLENVVISDPNDITTVQLVDFGFTKKCADTSNYPKGTRGYIHYNAISVLGKYTRSVDMWALGVMLIELLEGIKSSDQMFNIQKGCSLAPGTVCTDYYKEVYNVYTVVVKKYPAFKDLLHALFGKHKCGLLSCMQTPTEDAFLTNTKIATTPTYAVLLDILRTIPQDGGRRKSVRNSRVGKRKSKKIFQKNIKSANKKR